MTVPSDSGLCEIRNCSLGKKNAKYRCPRCFLKYCSLNCWKEHSKVECKKVLDTCLSMEIDTAGSLHSKLYSSDDAVDSESLEKLKYDKQIQDMIRNPSLRQIIEEVDEAQNVRNTMQQAMMEPIFVEFADKCLKLVRQSVEYEGDISE